jgi:hypothetical protein
MTQPKPKSWLLIPYGFLSLIAIISIALFAGEWLDNQWIWLSLVILVPVALLENMKSGHSAMKVMFWKLFWTMLSFLLAGAFFGYLIGKDMIGYEMPWYYLLAIGIILLIELANIYSLLKAVKREFGAFQ